MRPSDAAGGAHTGAGPAEPALEVRRVRKSFAGVTVLHGVDLVVRPSTVHALVGHNGSGKSTLIKALAGFHAPDEAVTGQCFGKPFNVGDHAAADGVGLRFVHQDLGLVDELSAVDNLALGVGYPVRARGLIRGSEAARRARAAMDALGYDIDVTMPVGHLSASERTGVAIARALEEWTGTPSVVVLDEPTASMPAPEVRRLFRAIDLLRERGLGIVYVSHYLDEILELADDVTVLRNGVVVMARDVKGLTHDDLVTAIVGRDLAVALRADHDDHREQRPAVMEVEDLATDGLHGISFDVGAGEIIGLAGIVGSGRHDVLPAIAGAMPRRGSVRIGDREVRPARPRSAIRAGLGLVPSNRRTAAVLPTFPASSNLTVSGLQEFTRFGLLRGRAEASDVDRWLTELEVMPRNPGAPILTLSGGNQQKVMVGRWLRRAPRVLALDEPTQGVDIGATQSIYRSIRTSSEAGNGVLISSSDGDELAAICDRVLVLVGGRIAAELTGSQLEAENIEAISLGDRTGATA